MSDSSRPLGRGASGAAPLGHSSVAHRELGWCSHCTGVTTTAEIMGWRRHAQGIEVPDIAVARIWSRSNPAEGDRSEDAGCAVWPAPTPGRSAD